MTIAPMRFCAHPGCSERVSVGRCPAHTRQAQHRTSAHARGYTRAWEHFRTVTYPSLLVERDIPPACGARLQAGPNPYSQCARSGRLNMDGLELDHDPPLQQWERSKRERVCDPHRVGYLCKTCHTAKTNVERLEYRVGGKGMPGGSK